MLLDNELARRGGTTPGDATTLQLRTEPLRLHWEFDDLVAADGHEVRLTFTCSVRALSAPTEIQMLREVLMLGRHRLTDRDLAEHLQPSLRSAAARVIESKPGAELLTDESRAALNETLRTAAHGVAFSCGVETLSPFSIQIESPSLQQQRLRTMERELAEQHAAGQVQHFQRAADLLKQFQAIRESTPALSAGKILGQINPTDQGTLLRTLLQGTARAQGGQTLFAVAGPYLVSLESSSAESFVAAPQLFPLPPTLGPLRSVTDGTVDGDKVLLIGARSGLMVVKPSNLEEAEEYVDPDIQTQLGFSSAAYLRTTNELCGCHGEAGIVFWRRGELADPVRTIRPADLPTEGSPPPLPMTPTYANGSTAVSMMGAGRATGPRNICSLDGSRAIFNIGAKLGVARSDGSLNWLDTASRAEIVSILPADRHLFVVHEDGTVTTLDRATSRQIRTENRGGRVMSAALLPWMGGTRLLLACREGPIQCVGEDDSLVTQYAAPHAGLRILAAAPDRIAAVSPDRQRLVLWDSWDGRKPAAEVYIGGLARHRIADICFST